MEQQLENQIQQTIAAAGQAGHTIVVILGTPDGVTVQPGRQTVEETTRLLKTARAGTL